MTINDFTGPDRGAPLPEGSGLSGLPPSEWFGHAEVDPGHRPSHLHLLSRVPEYGCGCSVPRLPLSAVLVPTSRPFPESGGGLALAARIAEAKDAQLVVIRSGAAVEGPFPRAMAPDTSRPMLVVDLPDDYPGLPVGRRTAASVVDTLHRDTDLGHKRNMAMILGVLCGWDTLLMLDDDITDEPAAQVPAQSPGIVVDPLLRLDDVLADFAADPRLGAAAYVQKNFDDNSVVCHARKWAGRPQGEFVSGGALAVRLDADLPFFPAAYNEDWLFFFGLLAQGVHRLPSSALKVAGYVHQRAYYPYRRTRAQSEELGDVLAEGLFALVGRPRHEVFELASRREYWESVVRERQGMITSLLEELRRRHGTVLRGTLLDIDEALLAALTVYTRPVSYWATELARYTRHLLQDFDDWRELLDGLAPATTGDVLGIEAALSVLGLEKFATFVRVPGKRESRRLFNDRYSAFRTRRSAGEAPIQMAE